MMNMHEIPHNFEEFAAFENQGFGALELLDGRWTLVDFRRPTLECKTPTESNR